MMDRKEELEHFKQINLIEYAMSRNFILDKRSSSKNSVVVRHSNGDKLIIGRDSTGVYYYFNAKGADSGTIIDLVASLDGSNLGEIRKTLRSYQGGSPMTIGDPAPTIDMQPKSIDTEAVQRVWMKMKPLPVSGHPYLTNYRGISTRTQHHPVFHDRIRIDSRNNAVFPHFGPGDSGVCGFELKNGNASDTSFTGFSPGGTKALCCSRPRDTDREAVICETAIDMLSLAELEGTDSRRFFSTAGQISSNQAEFLRSAISRMPSGSRVVIATDNDDGGHALAARIRDALRTVDIEIIQHQPKLPGDDWNDVLVRTRRNDSMEIRLG